MFKDYMVIDNALENPNVIRNKFLESTFFTKEQFDVPDLKISRTNVPFGNWRGFRSEDISLYDNSLDVILTPLLKKIFVFDFKFRYTAQLYGHITNNQMEEIIPVKNRWHKDEDVLAGVIYLSKNPVPNSGTWLKLKNKKIHVENKFNRMLIYRADLEHRPGIFFGSNAEDCRLTLTFFLREIRFYR